MVVGSYATLPAARHHSVPTLSPSDDHRPLLTSAEWAALVCAFIWAFNGLVLRTQSEKVSPAAMNTIRCGLAGLVMWMALPFDTVPLSQLSAVSAREWGMLFASFSVGIALGDTLYLVAIKEMGISRTMALTGTFPLTTLFWQTVLLEYPFEPSLAVGGGLVVLGVVFLSRSDKATDTEIRLRYGIALALFASLTWGFSSTLLKPATANMTSLQANAIRMPLIALLVYVVRVLPSGNRRMRGIGWRSFFLVGITGVLGMGFGAYLFIYAISQTSPAKVVTLTSSSPLFGMVMAAIFLKEPITRWIAAGMLLCLAGVWVVI